LVVSYQEVVMPKRYARDFRRAVCARLVAGEKVSSLSKELGVSEPTLYHWKRQALIDAGRAEGIKSFEADELAQALRTVAELEAELEAVKAASALFNGEEIVGPKGVARLPKH
jgi:transposase-like protein